MSTDDKLSLLKSYIEDSGNIVFFGGAGVSTESGVPDFRSKDGLYNNRGVEFEKYAPEYLLSVDCLYNEPEVFFEFYRQKLDARNVKPNAAHIALAELERRGKLKAVITQNIDGLHQAAGSQTVYEIHGTTKRNYCQKCGKIYPPDYIFTSKEPVPRCGCGGVIRCDVTLYGEQLPEDAVRGAVRAISDADMLIVAGTSLTVYPAASYIEYFRGRYMAVINKTPLRLFAGGCKTVQINDSVGKVLESVI